MKRNILLLALLFVAAFSAFAQIEEEIQQSKKEKIAKGRAYLLEKFLDRDYDKVKEIKDYLLGLEDDNYAAIAPVELWHILFWTEEFDALTTDIRSYDSIRFVAFKNKVKPVKDALGEQLYRRSVEDEHLLRFNLQEAQLSKEDFDFLTLLLDWDLKPDSPENQKSWNESVEKFLSDYPNSGYEWYARNIIRQPYLVDSDFGWGMGLDLCSGFSTGVFPKPIFGLGLSFDIVYKRFDLMLGYEILFSKTRFDQPISGGEVCPKDSNVLGMPLYAMFGYYVIDNKSFRLAPAVGVGCNMETYATKEYPQYKELEKYPFMWQGGLVLDFKLKSGGFGYGYGYGYGYQNKRQKETNYIRIRYNFGVAGLGNGNVSTLHVISVGWSGIMKKQKVSY